MPRRPSRSPASTPIGRRTSDARTFAPIPSVDHSCSRAPRASTFSSVDEPESSPFRAISQHRLSKGPELVPRRRPRLALILPLVSLLVSFTACDKLGGGGARTAFKGDSAVAYAQAQVNFGPR